MKQQTKYWLKWIASIVICIPAMFFVSLKPAVFFFANYFERKYPHDGQNSLGAALAGLACAVVLALGSGLGLLIYALLRSDKLEMPGASNL